MSRFQATIAPNIQRLTEDLAVHLMGRTDAFYEYIIKEFKEIYDRFWNPLLPVDEMQALCDYYFNMDSGEWDFTNPAEPKIVMINAMDKFFNSAERGLKFLIREELDDFSLELCPEDWRGLKLPDYPDVTYRRYYTAGWLYTIDPDHPKRIIVTEPCQWVKPKVEEQPQT